MKKSIDAQPSGMEKPLSFTDVNVPTSLEVLENDFWGPPTFPSNLVKTCHKIRTLPLNQLTIEHLRMAILQKISLPYLVPLAVQKLQNDPLAEGAFYEGDLLNSVLNIPDEYFEWDKASAANISIIALKAEAALKSKDDPDEVDRDLLTLIAVFTEKYG